MERKKNREKGVGLKKNNGENTKLRKRRCRKMDRIFF